MLNTTLSRRNLLAGLGAVGALGVLSGCSAARVEPVRGVPGKMVWSTYTVGTGTYNDFAAIANTFTSREGIQVRLLSADTGVGRLGPAIRGTAQYARTSVEYYYAFEGEDEFCSEVWGPQPVRLVWTPTGNYGILVRSDSGVSTVEELRGKKVPNVTAATAINRNIEAMLNYGGLTYDDVQLVDIGYSEQVDAIKAGQLDVIYSNPSSAGTQELATEYGVTWLDFSDADPARFETWEHLVPMLTTGPMTEGAGLPEGDSVVNLVYTMPVVSTSEQPASEVESFVSLMVEHFDDYKDSTADAPNFALDSILLSPLVTPFHEGTVAYLEKAGRWTPGLQARQDALLERERLLAEAWPGFWEAHANHPDRSRLWRDWKRENFPPLPAIDDLPSDQPDA